VIPNYYYTITSHMHLQSSSNLKAL